MHNGSQTKLGLIQQFNVKHSSTATRYTHVLLSAETTFPYFHSLSLPPFILRGVGSVISSLSGGWLQPQVSTFSSSFDIHTAGEIKSK